MAKLYVGNLSFDTTDESLNQLFVSNGFQIASARVIRDAETGRSRGFGFVELGPGDDMAKVITALNGFNLEGRVLQVNEARPQAPRGVVDMAEAEVTAGIAAVAVVAIAAEVVAVVEAEDVTADAAEVAASGGRDRDGGGGGNRRRF